MRPRLGVPSSGSLFFPLRIFELWRRWAAARRRPTTHHLILNGWSTSVRPRLHPFSVAAAFALRLEPGVETGGGQAVGGVEALGGAGGEMVRVLVLGVAG